MLNRSKKATRLISLAIIAILLTSPTWLNFIQTVEAGSANPESRNVKVSPLVNSSNHSGDETVTVILTLNGSPSGRLTALLAQNGVHQRRDMKELGVLSVTVPY